MKQLMKCLIYLFLIFTGISAFAQQSYSINGTVNDEKGQSVPGATVFLTNTKNATATDANGKFVLNNLSIGPYEVVIKMLGFTPDIRIIKIENTAVTINVQLKEANISLNTVTINGKPDPNREKYIAWFIKNFIGQSVNAGQCKLVNPDVLIFYYNKQSNILNAYADDFIVIENKGLGYRVKYLLKQFRYYKNAGTCYYEGSPYFEELAGDEEQQKEWEINRRASYLGSDRHFFRAIMNNTAGAEGFSVIENTYYPGMDLTGFYKPRNVDSLFVTINNTKALITKSPSRRNNRSNPREEFYITYKLANQPDLFYKTGYPEYVHRVDQKLQTSRIQTFADTIKINKELLLNPTIAFRFSGYWAWERIAEYLPLDYFVDPLAEKKE